MQMKPLLKGRADGFVESCRSPEAADFMTANQQEL